MTKYALLNDRLYIPEKHVTREQQDEYTYKHVKIVKEVLRNSPRKCINCNHWGKAWRGRTGKSKYCHTAGFNEDDVCPKFEYQTIERKEEVVIESFAPRNNAYAFSRGDLGKLSRVFSDFEIVDERAAPPMGIPLTFGGPTENPEAFGVDPDRVITALRPIQERILREWLDHGYGIIKAPTASGKSVMLCWLIAHLGVKTLLLSHERRHLKVLQERLYEATNLGELETEAGEPLLGYFKRGKGDFPITLSTFQAFNSKLGKKALGDIKDNFGLIWVDECHHSGASTYHWVFSGFNSFYRGGTTATPTRKDKLHFAIYNTLGPVVAESKVEQLACKVTWVRTGIAVPPWIMRRMYPFSMIQTWLGKCDELNDLILDMVIKDIRDDRKVLILLERRAQCFLLQRNLEASGYKVELILGGQNVGKIDFSEINRRLVDGELHAIIGTKVMNENVDIPRLDCLHLPTPSANNEMEEQRVGRIRRPWPPGSTVETSTKPTPLVRAYCYDGAKLANVGEHTRRRVYTRLGFIEATHDVNKPKQLSLVERFKKKE